MSTGRIAEEAGSYQILEALAKTAESYLCVGVQEGECLMHVLKGNPDIKRIALCDTWGPHHGGTNRGNHEHIAQKLKNTRTNAKITWLDGPSQDLIPTLKETFDLTYVDGDHAEEPAYTDLKNVWPLTVKAMVVHDTFFPTVTKALARFVQEHPCDVEFYTGGTGSAIVRRKA